MNRNMPSKGCDPMAYNDRTRTVKEAKITVKAVRHLDPVTRTIAGAVLSLCEARRDALVNPEASRFARAGSISGGKKSEWVLRA